MRERKGSGKWHLVLGAITVGVFGFSLTLQGKSPATTKPGPADGTKMIIAGNGIPDNLNLPVFPPVKVDYRSDGVGATINLGSRPVAIGPPNLTFWEPGDGNDRALSTCLVHAQCAICDKCIEATCEAGKCTYTPQNGVFVPGCDDGQYCNGEEECVAGTCIDGTPPCSDPDVCDENADACVTPCASAGDCNDDDDCTRDSCGADTVCVHEDICSLGRCCTGEYPVEKVCQSINLPACEAKQGRWAEIDDACQILEPSQHMNGCPKYSSGIAPEGDFIVEIGPISWLECDDYFAIGDDYEAQNYPDDEYMQVHFLRFAAGVLPRASARWSIGFHDQNGILIENVFWPDGINDSGGLGVRTVDFDPALTIPTKGRVTFRVQPNFGLAGRVTLLSTTCPADKGINDCGSMIVDDVLVTDFLGQCSGGDRDGEFCDRRNGNDDCPGGGTCVDVPDVLAFELIGSKTTAPLAACCQAAAPICTTELPWICKQQGNFPQEVGSLCGICQDGFTVCDSDDVCVDAGAGSPCKPLPVCNHGACCEPADGTCLEEPDEAVCQSPRVWKGYGSECEPNCCEQPDRTGCDNCNQPVPHVINVPPLGSPPVTVTITGNNSGATFDDYPDHCDAGIFNIDGGTKDPGWWEEFTITDCAELRIDLCCTDILGEPLRPAWGNLVRDEGDGGICCDTWFGSNGVEPPIGIGEGTAGFARGGPFCDEDNLWMTFGPLRAGKYQYPVYSAPLGTAASPPGAQYQFHITVGACPVAACCQGAACSSVNQLVCRDLDGYWLRGVVACGTLCETGSCCLGPGVCEDETPAGEPITEPDCTILGGDYVGGANCDSDPPPCPICDIEGPTNCQLPDLTSPDLVMMSDQSMPPGGVVVADDFIPTQATINIVCTWGAYLDAIEIRAAAAHYEGDDCTDDVIDAFKVTVYPDVDGLPDDKNPIESLANVIAKGPVDSVWVTGLYGDAQMYAYQLELKTPITGMTPGIKYWIEIANNTAEDADGGRCMWHWAQTSLENNGFHMVGVDRKVKNPAYMYGMGRAGAAGDMSFCIDQPFTPPLPVDGVCCDCDTATCTVTVLADCSGIWDQAGVCAGGCSTVVDGDVCLVNPIVTSDLNFTHPFHSGCTDTDGPDNVLSELGRIDVGSDIWIHYIAPCAGKVRISMCGTGNADNSFDSALVVYKDNTDPFLCACPGDPGFQQIGLAQDESCNGIADGGAGYMTPPPTVAVGHCLTVRAGGYDAQVGTGTVKIACEEAPCTPSNPPNPDPQVVDFAGFGTRNRYLSFVAKDAGGLPRAMRVTFDSLPPPHDIYDGDQYFVGQPVQVTEASCCNGTTPPPTSWMATLQCGTPFYADWANDYGVVHVYHGGIIPGASYSIQAIADDCLLDDENSYSLPTSIDTSVSGDVVGNNLVPPPASAPQGIVDFNDISAVVEKFRNLPAAIQKARADVIHSNILIPPPDHKIDFVDISAVVAAFRGAPVPLPGPVAHCP